LTYCIYHTFKSQDIYKRKRQRVACVGMANKKFPFLC